MKNFKDILQESFYSNIGGKNLVHAENTFGKALKDVHKLDILDFKYTYTDEFNKIKDVWLLIKDPKSHAFDVYYKEKKNVFWRSYIYYHFKLEDHGIVWGNDFIDKIYKNENFSQGREYKLFDSKEELLEYISHN